MYVIATHVLTMQLVIQPEVLPLNVTAEPDIQDHNAIVSIILRYCLNKGRQIAITIFKISHSVI